MPTNQIYKPNRNLSKVRDVGGAVAQGTPLIVDGRPGVTDSDSGGSTRTEVIGGTTIEFPSGGVGLDEDFAVVHFDGTFEFEVTGATTSTDSGVPVYLTSAGALTLTEGSNTYFGVTDYPTGYAKVAGRAPVQIGVAE